MPNSHYARFEFSATELADGVDTAFPFAQSTGYSETESTMNLRFGKENYAGNADFAQAKGVIDLEYPLTVQTLSIAREDRIAQEMYGLFMDGPFVLDLDFDNGRADPSFSVDVYGPLRAFDAQGRALKSGRDLHAQITEHGYASVHAFHGPIARLELDIVTRMAHVEIR